jgi:hypothetical protein
VAAIQSLVCIHDRPRSSLAGDGLSRLFMAIAAAFAELEAAARADYVLEDGDPVPAAT